MQDSTYSQAEQDTHARRREAQIRDTLRTGQAVLPPEPEPKPPRVIRQAILASSPQEYHLRAGDANNAELYDVHRIAHACADRVLYTPKNLWLSGNNGLWIQANGNAARSAMPAVTEILGRARESVAWAAAGTVNDEDPELPTITADQWLEMLNWSDRHTKGTLLTLDRERERLKDRISTANESGFASCRILPFNDGTGLDTETGQTLNTEELRREHIPDFGWDIPPTEPNDPGPCPDPQVQRLIENHYGPELIELTASALRPLQKSVPTIIAHSTDWGKTTWLEAVARCFPGAVHIDAKSSSITRNGFSQDTAPLATHLIVAYDEIDKGKDPIPVGWLNQLTAEDYTVELKGQNPFKARRVAAPFLVGATFPQFTDPSGQGMDSRLDRVFEAKSTSALTRDDRNRIFDQIDWLRQVLIWRACHPDHLSTSALRENATAALDEATDDFDLALSLILKPSTRSDFVSTATIIAHLQQLANDDPGTYDHEDYDLDQLTKAIKDGLTKNGTRLKGVKARVRQSGPQQHGYKGLALTRHMLPEEEEAEAIKEVM